MDRQVLRHSRLEPRGPMAYTYPQGTGLSTDAPIGGTNRGTAFNAASRTSVTALHAADADV